MSLISVVIGECDHGIPCKHTYTLTYDNELVVKTNLDGYLLTTDQYWPHVDCKKHFKYMQYILSQENHKDMIRVFPYSLFLADYCLFQERK